MRAGPPGSGAGSGVGGIMATCSCTWDPNYRPTRRSCSGSGEATMASLSILSSGVSSAWKRKRWEAAVPPLQRPSRRTSRCGCRQKRSVPAARRCWARGSWKGSG
ncbi:hypothetical protein llap_22927 [Limosa lapponica baueri]|uniref:Uncharacterized protein n=1 Tax=Limosa lapponica baueri TaxID=1758121 RepID=A0A2I0SZ11_LIMLA|nr:hypothetical protein llap_22927 [Limosa lapponica baueri]